MDLTALSQSVITALTAVASVTLSISPVVPPSEVKLTDPEIISSYNLPAETSSPESLQNLNIISNAQEGMKLIVKEAQAEEITVKQPEYTVEQPEVIFTVAEPTPKPALLAKSSPEPDINKIYDTVKTSLADSEKPKPSSTPSSTPSPSPQAASSVKTEVTPSSSNGQILFDMTNSHRSKIGKPAFEKDERLCKIAEARAPQVPGELAGGTLHKGFKDLNLPYWATENIAAYSTMEQNFNFLITDYIHKKAIESDAKYSCTACVGTSCSQIFSSFLPK